MALKAHCGRFLSGVGKTPGAVRMLSVGEVGQVVLDITSRIFSCARHVLSLLPVIQLLVYSLFSAKLRAHPEHLKSLH